MLVRHSTGLTEIRDRNEDIPFLRTSRGNSVAILPFLVE
jgi:hypothetical protein